jgi:hypothetical protein
MYAWLAAYVSYGCCCCCCCCRLLEHGAADDRQLQQLVAPMSDQELLQVGKAVAQADSWADNACIAAANCF